MIGITHDFGSGGTGSGDDFPPLPGQTAYTAADYGCEDFDEVSQSPVLNDVANLPGPVGQCCSLQGWGVF